MKIAFTATPVAYAILGSLVIGSVCGGCLRRSTGAGADPSAVDGLVGAWRSQVRFRNGPFASMKDLSFMYVFNAGGTMTESSNYDADPPVPPAYGSWRRVGPTEFEAHYEFFVTRPPAAVTDLTGGGGWLPAGRGILVEKIVLSADGRSFTSKITYTAVDSVGNPVPGGGEADVSGARIGP